VSSGVSRGRGSHWRRQATVFEAVVLELPTLDLDEFDDPVVAVEGIWQYWFAGRGGQCYQMASLAVSSRST
jgi:hypothetical protein